MKKPISLILILFIFKSFVVADEGMWLPLLIKQQAHAKMTELGLQLSAEDIYDINNSSLKDAITGFGSSDMPLGFFCTGEIISDQGLMLTNHHCGFGAIQEHSSLEHDYLSDGFWAKSKANELPNEGMTVSFLVRMEDVTDRILKELSDTMSENARNEKIDEIASIIEKEAKANTHYNTSVESMFENNKFYLLVYETFEDVRLVGAPPSSIGKFGGDTDNWMWPRHTGDFCMFRVYSAPDGKPAKYSPNNIPLKPKHFLPISLKGVKKNDYAMIMGFPGSTDRYLTSYGVEETIETLNPAAIKIRTRKLEIINQAMAASDKVRIQYASKKASSSNYWKYFIGQNKGLKRLGVYNQKKGLENQLQNWINQDESRKTKYGEALNLIHDAYAANQNVSLAQQYIYEAVFDGSEIAFFPYKTLLLYDALSSKTANADSVNMLIESLKSESVSYFKDYDVQTDKKLFAELFNMYYNDVPKEYHFAFFDEINSKYKGDFNKYADVLFSKSIFADENKFKNFLENPTAKVLDKDMAMTITKQILHVYFGVYMQTEASNEKLAKGKRLFVAALMEMEKDKNFYPDANSTLRVTYGTVGDYHPADGVKYNYYTTIKGIMEKEDPTNEEFIVPEKLKKLYRDKDYGMYGEDGDLKVCFTTNNDITGGNSGSPVINANGELIGAAFDGNWEAMSGDIAFENGLQKTIVCDIRYVLFIVDKFAGASYLVEEMSLVK
ncbi:MAG TPA: serine protease [Bacteroidales bacterium]|nr:MAG: peptidase S46 [Bacteroidetes bacterium GWF2_33_38]OFY76051.1 MAG: peptidase S46 [Bacteroidetes bacterium RIFOXYA12_FULL_33_9]OFY91257.1 MAG: peptidase S46 [Bacteroidetes bacterium RIFOXYA2_FULL_33_7]HBF87932.1 serine protease [Bacteroidales bacterium]